jgi:hypothetical protein
MVGEMLTPHSSAHGINSTQDNCSSIHILIMRLKKCERFRSPQVASEFVVASG